MYYVLIDCGTTNSRVYITDGEGTVYGLEKETVGVRDSANLGRDFLLGRLRELISKAVAASGVGQENIAGVFASGMITSEIGLCEIPHLTAPCGLQKLAGSIVRMDRLRLLGDAPVYFVRGIKNRAAGDEGWTAQIGSTDFMRGEEVQMLGLMARQDIRLPAIALVLSSHSKFIALGESGDILGSVTTMSGQLFSAVKDGTFLGKSVEKRDAQDEPPAGYFDEDLVREAKAWVDQAGLTRTMMFPRFMDVLMETKWYERRLLLSAMIAADDLRCIGQVERLTGTLPKQWYLIGSPQRCRLYEFLLGTCDAGIEAALITDEAGIDSLSTTGLLAVAARARLLGK